MSYRRQLLITFLLVVVGVFYSSGDGSSQYIIADEGHTVDIHCKADKDSKGTLGRIN